MTNVNKFIDKTEVASAFEQRNWTQLTVFDSPGKGMLALV